MHVEVKEHYLMWCLPLRLSDFPTSVPWIAQLPRRLIWDQQSRLD